MRKPAYAETKTQISYSYVVATLISVLFAFRITVIVVSILSKS